jgi:DNA-binding transcriptional MerR regulator
MALLTVPEKYFYTIGDVCKMTGTKPHILRYWEGQFKLLRPARRYSGHRKYTQREIDLINRIKYLILEKKYTLAGAKKEMNRQATGKPSALSTGPATASSAIPFLKEIKKDIDECLSLLRSDKLTQQELIRL